MQLNSGIMKRLIALLFASMIIVSCGTKFSLQKRKYTKGFYFSLTQQKKENHKIPDEVAVVEKAKEENVPVEVVSKLVPAVQKNILSKENISGNEQNASSDNKLGKSLWNKSVIVMRSKLNEIADLKIKKTVEQRIQKIMPRPLMALSFFMTALFFAIVAAFFFALFAEIIPLFGSLTKDSSMQYMLISAGIAILFIVMAIKKLI